MSKDCAKNLKNKKGLPQWFNFLSALTGIIVLSPLFIVVSILIKLTSKGPVFFKQKRVGKNLSEFYLYKFRTMAENPENLKITVKGDKRITKIGKILRKTKIDELPQLVNVLKGDMAIVGPRPEVKEYVELNIDEWKKIMQIKPGITDPVTLKLRNEEDLLLDAKNPEEFYRKTLAKFKIKGYLQYLSKRSFAYDFKIIVITLFSVFFPNLTPPPTLEEIYREIESG